MIPLILGVVAGSRTSGGGGYTAPAVHFDGATWLRCASLASTNSGVFSFSLWRKVEAGQVQGLIPYWVSDPENQYDNAGYNRKLDDGDGWAPRVDLSNGGDALSLHTATSISAPTVWANVLGSFDVSASDPADWIAKLYVNDVDIDDPDETSKSGAGFTILTNGLSFVVGGDTFEGDGIIGDMADVWIAPNVSLLTAGSIPEATRRLFISAGGKPVNPSGFPASAILLSGNASAFGTNQGTGGAFVATGTLTNASTSPSD